MSKMIRESKTELANHELSIPKIYQLQKHLLLEYAEIAEIIESGQDSFEAIHLWHDISLLLNACAKTLNRGTWLNNPDKQYSSRTVKTLRRFQKKWVVRLKKIDLIIGTVPSIRSKRLIRNGDFDTAIIVQSDKTRAVLSNEILSAGIHRVPIFRHSLVRKE